MPRFNATGPSGYGPGTGRGLGPCGCGFFRTRFYSRKNELSALEEEEKFLQEELEAIREEKEILEGQGK